MTGNEGSRFWPCFPLNPLFFATANTAKKKRARNMFSYGTPRFRLSTGGRAVNFLGLFGVVAGSTSRKDIFPLSFLGFYWKLPTRPRKSAKKGIRLQSGEAGPEWL